MEEIDNNKSFIKNKVAPTLPKSTEIGIDTDNAFANTILDAMQSSNLNISSLDNFTNVAQSREQIYQLIDTMSRDSTIASVIETYAEDASQVSDNGKIVWCESSDEYVSTYVTYLLDSLNVDKHIYSWFNKLVKYGDVYFKLYRESDYDDPIFKKQEENKQNRKLNEDIQLNLYPETDHFVHYIEAIKNPATMFELTKFGRTMGYINAPVITIDPTTKENYMLNYMQYNMKKNDVELYQATDFVHAFVEDNTSRIPEEVNIYNNDDDMSSNTNKMTYTVRRGQSLLANCFKIWRELTLLENAVLLNRITRSSQVKIIEIETGDMPKDQVRNTLRNFKQMVEQKSAINTGEGMNEYTNPGPVENIIYVPTKGELGKVNTTELGSEQNDPKSLIDLEYYRDKLFAALRIPKQFFGFVDDAAGFSGGDSLAQISSRYAKSIKNYQNIMLQALTDVINIYLLDKGLDNYINKFTLRIQEPLTKEVSDRVESTSNKIRMVSDLLTTLDNVDDPIIRLKMEKLLLSNTYPDPELTSLIQQQIDKLELGDNDVVSNKKDFDDNVPLNNTRHIDINDEDERDMEIDDIEEIETQPENEDEEELPKLDNEISLPSASILNNIEQ